MNPGYSGKLPLCYSYDSFDLFDNFITLFNIRTLQNSNRLLIRQLCLPAIKKMIHQKKHFEM
jgi:hypothetical protein